MYEHALESPNYRYVASLYFAVVTMTTTGYGDVGGHYSRGFFAIIVIVIAGMVVFAYALSVLAATLANTDAPKYATTAAVFAVLYGLTRNMFCGTWYLAHSQVYSERTVPIIMAGCIVHGRKRPHFHFRF